MVPIAHGGSAGVFKATSRRPLVSPLVAELFAVMKPGDRDTLVWMQNAEPLSLYCGTRRTARRSAPASRSRSRCTRYEIGGTATEPSLATDCSPNEDLLDVDLHAPRGRDVP